ncbi:MAG: peptidoglycan DD-metalloendopeptidase family protein [Actinomycetota bacterium]
MGVASAAEGVGGAAAPGTPVVRDAVCLSGCVGLRKATVGGMVQVSGRNMAAVQKVSFPGARKRILAPVTATTNTTAQAVVPAGAKRGKVRVRDGYGQASELSEQKLVIRPRSQLRSSASLQLVEAEVSPAKTYYFGKRQATLNFVIASALPANDLRVDVVSPTGEVVKTFFPTSVIPNATSSVSWDGTGSDGRPAASGWYVFRISGADGVAAARAQGSQLPDLSIAVYGYIFPIQPARVAHSYGDGLGAGRGHQGQDVFAKCGSRLVAARGGRVEHNAYHGAAGNYIVIDLKGSGEDHAYMHLVSRSPLQVGQVVRTGQYIGDLGDSGNASGCHLHFERWSAPGWYEGGSVLDPTTPLKQWDKYS